MPHLNRTVLSLIVMMPLLKGAEIFAQAQTNPTESRIPAEVLLNTTLEAESGTIILDEVVIYEGTVVRQLTYQDLQKPELIGYQNSGSSPALYAHPVTPGTEIVEINDDTGSPVSEDVRLAAKNYLTDSAINSVFFDIGSEGNGLAMRFSPPLVNAPGVDLLIGEMSATRGSTRSGCPDTPSPGGDNLRVRLDDGTSTTVESGDYTQQMPLGVMRYYGKEELREGTLITSVADLENYPASERNVLNHLHLHTATVDLSALGVPEGESISQIVVEASPVEVTVDGESVQCFTGDPAFVFGISEQ
ncbi:hypothetical protein S7335_597 [Synechococcus sp. PCC 7335]|uniref:hypothetical protein n=1 Tax=Synechococcus sp. (strain ATCC 29403 / PCC 7335) TaxID=91464 RepID=UPI00017EC088|nr:hypothetical protein [Synechococcus sp. PCC 7335]EDX82892.1 hypothetical protein S7335_70 [Synechococcus sp. PCC 7335]EDX83417.1 hypothetical protein S7335_597 [Synechococcus sp. PCC 7335]